MPGRVSKAQCNVAGSQMAASRSAIQLLSLDTSILMICRQVMFNLFPLRTCRSGKPVPPYKDQPLTDKPAWGVFLRFDETNHANGSL